MSEKKVTILDVQQSKEEKRKLIMVTAYDYPSACWPTKPELTLSWWETLWAWYKKEVKELVFPGPEHSFTMPEEAMQQLKKMMDFS